YIRNIILVNLRIKILKFFAGIFLVAFQVKICTGMNTFHFTETKRKIIFNIQSCIGIMCKFYMIVETVFGRISSQRKVPVQAFFFPVFVPLHLYTRTYKILHFHLFKLAHTENKLSCNDLVTESFTDLCNPERNFL